MGVLVYLGIVVSELRESLVVRPEVVTPLTDTVSLVDHESRQLATTVEVSQCRQQLVAGTQLWGRGIIMCAED